MGADRSIQPLHCEQKQIHPHQPGSSHPALASRSGEELLEKH